MIASHASMNERSWYIRATLIGYPIWVALYFCVGYAASRLEPHQLSTSFDEHFPFVPQAVWVYMSTYVFPLFLVLVTRDWHRFNIALIALFIAHLVAFIVYCNWPVLVAKPVLGSSISDQIIAEMYRSEFRPWVNNFPSLHVTFSFVIAMCYVRQGKSRLKELLVIGWALAIAVSTLCIKQHILADLIGATALSLSSWWLASRMYSKGEPDESALDALRRIFHARRWILLFSIFLGSLITVYHVL